MHNFTRPFSSLNLRLCFFVSVVLFAVASSALKAANVQGILSGATTWTLAQSPIYVLGDVQVPAGSVLTIQPGVEVRFAGAYQILVQGAVQANGSSAAPILLRSSSPGVQSGATAFKFSGANLLLSSLSHLDFADLSLALRIGQETEHAQGGKNSGQLSASFIKARSATFLTNGYQTSASLLLEDVDLDDVLIQAAYPLSEPITLRRGTLSNSRVNPDSYSRGLTLESLSISDTAFTLGCCGASLTLRDSRLRGGSFSDYNNDYTVSIERCILQSVPLDLAQARSVSIEDSTLVYNGGSGVIAQNLLFLSSSVRGADTALTLFGTQNQITDSSLSANSTALVFSPQSSGSVSGSNFLLNTGLNLRNDSHLPINASGNHWGLLTSPAIESSITHHADDINRGLVSFSPFLSAPSSDAPLSPPSAVVKSAVSGGVSLQWAASSDSRVAGYRVYHGSDGAGGFAAHVDLGLVTTHTLAGLAISESIALTALTASADGVADQFEGNESWFAYAQVATAVPQIQVTPSSPHLGAVGLGGSATLQLMVNNPGTGSLTISNITSDNPRFTLGVTSLTVPAGEERALTLSFTPLATGAQQSTLSFTHNASASPLTLVVQGYGASSSGLGVQGILSGATTWTLAQSPIYVLGDVQVPAGSVLTIQPGVEVRFAGAYQILVQGAVQANGSSAAPILLRSSSPGVQSGATAFKFSGANLLLSSLSHLDFADLSLALRIGQETEHAQGGKNSGQLSASFIKARSATFLTNGYQTSASLLLEDVDLDDVLIQAAYPLSEPITLRRGTLSNSRVNPDSYSRGLTLESLSISDTAFTLGCCGASLTLRDSRLRGGYISDYNNDYTVSIERCILQSVPLDLTQARSVSIEDSTLVYNGGPGVIAQNLLFLSSSVRGADTALTLFGTQNQITDSSLSANSTALVFSPLSSGSVSGSNFLLNTGLNLRNDSHLPVNASGNHWGLLTSPAIESSITHHADDINRGLVSFSPFLSAPSSDAPLSALRVVQAVSAANEEREIYWSRAIEPGVSTYRVHVFASTDDTTPQQSWTVGDVNHHTIPAIYAGQHVAVTACKDGWDPANSLATGNESWFAWSTPAPRPDWFELYLQPRLTTTGEVTNTANQPLSARILSWTLPPSVIAGQSVRTTIRVEYSDEVSPTGTFDRTRLVSASVFGSWQPETKLAQVTDPAPNGDPRVEEYALTFVAPTQTGPARLRLALAYGGGSVFHFHGEDNAGRVGPFADISLEVVADNAPPLAPSGLHAFSAADSIYLKWTANSESNLAGYHVYRGSNAAFGAMTRLTATPVVLNEYTDASAAANATYFYRVVAVNGSGSDSPPSKAVSVTASRIVMTMDDYFGAPGSTVEMVVAAENARGVSGNGFDVRISYDPQILTPLSVATTPLTKRFQLADNASSANGVLNINGVSLDGTTIKGRGGLLVVRFQVDPSAPVGSVAEHTFTEVRLYDSDLQALAVDYSDTARFEVSPAYRLGDVNGDGEIDSLDGLMALQHAAGLRTLRNKPPEFAAADINKDAIVDAADVILIQKLAVGVVAASPARKVAARTASSLATPAPPYVSLSVANLQTTRGSVINVPVFYSGNVPVSGFDLGLLYDSRVLRLRTIERTTLTDPLLLQSDLRQGSPAIALAGGGELGQNQGDILNLSFEVIGNAGQTSPIRFSRVKAIGPDGADLADSATIDTTAATISITGTTSYQLSYSSDAHGHVEGPANQTVAPGTGGQPVLAVADPGYRFTAWSDGATTNPRTDTNVAADLQVSARFAPVRTSGGVPLVWYWQHELDPDGDEMDAMDTDGDGLSNRGEYLADTDPNDPASIFRVTELVRQNSGYIRLKWEAGSGAQSIRYELQYSTELGGAWTKLAEVDSSATTHEWSVTKPELASLPKIFFRVTVAPAPGAGE